MLIVQGLFFGHLQRSCPHSNPAASEALAARKAMLLATECNSTGVNVKGDAVVVYKAFADSGADISEIKLLLKDCLEILQSFTGWEMIILQSIFAYGFIAVIFSCQCIRGIM